MKMNSDKNNCQLPFKMDVVYLLFFPVLKIFTLCDILTHVRLFTKETTWNKHFYIKFYSFLERNKIIHPICVLESKNICSCEKVRCKSWWLRELNVMLVTAASEPYAACGHVFLLFTLCLHCYHRTKSPTLHEKNWRSLLLWGHYLNTGEKTWN